MGRNTLLCDTLETATEQCPPGYFVRESPSDDCAGCAFWGKDDLECKRDEITGKNNIDYPCDCSGEDAETTVYYHFRPLSEWKFGNEEA